MGKVLPITALIGDLSLHKHLTNQDNPWITNSLKLVLKSDVLKHFKLKKTFEILKWFAYDSQFIPSQHNYRFKEWTSLGLTTYYSLISKGTVRSFQDLTDKFGLQNQDLYRYLQIRDYIGKKMIKHYEPENDILQVFVKAYKDDPYKKIISKLCTSLQSLNKENTSNVKSRWETEGNIIISQDNWKEICKQQWKTTNSPLWRE